MKRYLWIFASLGLILMGQDGCGEDLDEDGYSNLEDCDDENADVHPGAEELCNGIDDNCDGYIDEVFDADADGYTSCDTPDNPADCDDENPEIFPGAPELCDGLDNNCDELVDEIFDLDLDGFTTCQGDCDDADATIHPAALDECDGLDNNCDGLVDEDFDIDQDGWTSCGGDCDDENPEVYEDAPEACDMLDNDCDGLVDEDFDRDADGFTTCDGDCDDEEPGINPAVEEVCDGIDNNCDGSIDEGVLIAWHLDADADGYGRDDSVIEACSAPTEAYIEVGGDCNDLEVDINPAMTELCNDIDDNCDGQVDEGFDMDADNVTTCGGDCNDEDPTIFPGAEDVCDGIDSNCDGASEETCSAPVASVEFSVEGDEAGTIGNWAYGVEPLTVNFDASGSYDPDGGDIVDFAWDFGDGAVDSGPVVSHAFYAEESDSTSFFIVSLTTTDDEGESAERYIWVTVCGTDYSGTCSTN